MLRRVPAQRRHATTSTRGVVRAPARSMARGRPYFNFGGSCTPNFVVSPSLLRRQSWRSDSWPHRDHRARRINATMMQSRVMHERTAAKTSESHACVRDSDDAANDSERGWTLQARCLPRLFRGLHVEGLRGRADVLHNCCKGLPTHAHRQDTQPGVLATLGTSAA